MYCLQDTHLKYKDTFKLKGQRKIYNANSNQRIAGVALLISDRTD